MTTAPDITGRNGTCEAEDLPDGSFPGGHTDAECVERVQQGDSEAFGELYARFHQRVFAIVFRMLQNDAWAQDVTQDVFIMALQKIGQLRTSGSISSWLSVIARNMAINALHTKPREHMVDHRTLIMHTAYQETAQEILIAGESAGDVLNTLDEGLRRMKSADREALELFYLRNQRVREMAAALRVPEGTVKRRLHIARKRLAEILMKSGTGGADA